MPAIHIRNVPESTLAALRERAAAHGRSMQQEVLEILATAAVPVPRPATSPVQLITTRTDAKTAWSREEVYGDDGR